MYVDNIVRDIRDTIYLNNINWDNVQKSKRDANDIDEAMYGLDQAMDALCMIDERLKQLIDMIEMEALSHKVRSK